MARDAGSTLAPRIGGRATLTLVVATTVSSAVMVLFHPALGLPVAGACLAGLVLGGRTLAALATSVLGTAVATGLAQGTLYTVVFPLVGTSLPARTPFVYAGTTLASLLIVGPAAAWLLRRRRAFEVVVLSAVALCAVHIAALSMLANGAGLTLVAFVRQVVAGVAEQMGSLQDVQEAVVEGWPSVMVALNGFVAVGAVAGAGRLASTLGVAVQRLPRLPLVDLDPRAALLPITAIAFLAAARLPIGVAGTLDVVGSNLLVIARWVFFVQGLALFAALYERAGLRRGARVFGFALLAVTEALIPLVSLAGLADIWLNLRRLPRDGTPRGPVETPPRTD